MNITEDLRAELVQDVLNIIETFVRDDDSYQQLRETIIHYIERADEIDYDGLELFLDDKDILENLLILIECIKDIDDVDFDTYHQSLDAIIDVLPVESELKAPLEQLKTKLSYCFPPEAIAMIDKMLLGKDSTHPKTRVIDDAHYSPKPTQLSRGGKSIKTFYTKKEKARHDPGEKYYRTIMLRPEDNLIPEYATPGAHQKALDWWLSDANKAGRIKDITGMTKEVLATCL